MGNTRATASQPWSRKANWHPRKLVHQPGRDMIAAKSKVRLYVTRCCGEVWMGPVKRITDGMLRGAGDPFLVFFWFRGLSRFHHWKFPFFTKRVEEADRIRDTEIWKWFFKESIDSRKYVGFISICLCFHTSDFSFFNFQISEFPIFHNFKIVLPKKGGRSRSNWRHQNLKHIYQQVNSSSKIFLF